MDIYELIEKIDKLISNLNYEYFSDLESLEDIERQIYDGDVNCLIEWLQSFLDEMSDELSEDDIKELKEVIVELNGYRS